MRGNGRAGVNGAIAIAIAAALLVGGTQLARCQTPSPPDTMEARTAACSLCHGKFGEGVILNLEGNGPHARVEVRFEQQGTKWLMLQYANLEPM